ncbi:MAG: hypothetical protein ABF289_10810 [Clostridiales bacterium]
MNKFKYKSIYSFFIFFMLLFLLLGFTNNNQDNGRVKDELNEILSSDEFKNEESSFIRKVKDFLDNLFNESSTNDSSGNSTEYIENDDTLTNDSNNDIVGDNDSQNDYENSDNLEDNIPNTPTSKPSNLLNTPVLFSGILKYIFIILLIVVLIVITILLIRKYRNKTIKPSLSEDLISNILEKPSDVEKKALDLKDKDIKESIRLLYIALLLELNKLNYIKIQKSKTNKQYLSELYNNKYDKFTQVEKFTFVFNKVWYGNKNINTNEFDYWYKEYSNLIKGNSL